jgi:hypothetical protein
MTLLNPMTTVIVDTHSGGHRNLTERASIVVLLRGHNKWQDLLEVIFSTDDSRSPCENKVNPK